MKTPVPLLAALAALALVAAPSGARAQGTTPPKPRVAGPAAKPAPPVRKETTADLMKEAKVTDSAARKTALAAVPGGKIAEGGIEREDGKLIYSFDIKVAGKSGVEEIAVDAITGAVIGHAHETPAQMAKEAAADKKPAPPAKPVKKVGGGL